MDRTPELVVEQEINKLNESLSLCKRVEETVSSKGWKEIIEPMIDKSITDVTGGKLNGRWYGGLLDRAKKEERREYYIGYKQALIDFHRRVLAYVDAIKVTESKRDELIKNFDVKYKIPMVNDSRYSA